MEEQDTIEPAKLPPGACEHCKGLGLEDVADKHSPLCTVCRGTGKKPLVVDQLEQSV